MAKLTFTYGAQVFINKLDEQGIAHSEYTTTEYCQDCSGAGMGCHCDDGVVEVLIVEYEKEPK